MFSICSSRSNESSCRFIKYKLLSHLLVFLNKQFYSWLFIQKLNISGTGEGSERRRNFHVYHKESMHKFLPGEVQAIYLIAFKG